MNAPRIVPAARIARADTPAPSRRFFSGLTLGAAALALGLATALPVRADPDAEDIAKTVLGLLIIGAIADEVRKDDPAPYPEPVHKKKKKKRHDYRVPSHCAIEISGKKRSAIVYPESCLLDAGVRAPLPYHCANEARIYGEWDVIFSERCLREAGFEVSVRYD